MVHDSLKKRAGEKAVEYVQSGMIVGLGEGTTAIWAIRLLGELVKKGKLSIFGIPCSNKVEQIARECGIPITTLNEKPVIDLTIDGADEVNANFELIKGGGGAFFREKMVAEATKREIIVIDNTKLSRSLGTKCSLPVEVSPFAWRLQIQYIRSLGATRVSIRTKQDGSYTLSDQGNYILDCNFGIIRDPQQLADNLDRRTGIIEHGLFLGLAHEIIVATDNDIHVIKQGDSSDLYFL